MHGVKRVLIFCLMTTILPTILIITPLYLRHSVFADVSYQVTESDVLAIEDGISSLFCSSHSLKMNTSFNAFQMNGIPQPSTKRKHIRLKKSMTLPDDTFEYWGFYLMKGALVKLKVCSRFNGSRILVVRGVKNLNTCGILDHNLKKYGAKMDEEHKRVKVTFENRAEIIGIIENNLVDKNTAAEDISDDDNIGLIKRRLEQGRLNKNLSSQNETENNLAPKRHHKRHIYHKNTGWRRKIHDLRRLLETENDIHTNRIKRGIPPLDGKIQHGGNAYDLNMNETSVSSFEMDLLTCYDGQILLTQGFKPSQHCNDVHYLENSNHMVTIHEVAKDGYYYYIFYSDNDDVKNDIHAVFDIYKPTYHYANISNGNDCINRTECTFPISFLSDETVIVEVPTKDGIEEEEDYFTLISTCHPRTGVYAIFPISVLLLILGCAFL